MGRIGSWPLLDVGLDADGSLDFGVDLLAGDGGEDVVAQVDEGCLHIEALQRRCLVVSCDAGLLQEVLDILIGDLPVLLQIGLVAHQTDAQFLVGVGAQFVQPLPHVAETHHRAEVEHQKRPDAALVVRPRDRLERLLPRRVPQLQFDLPVPQGDHLGAELDAEGGLVLVLEAPLDEAEEEAALADV